MLEDCLMGWKVDVGQIGDLQRHHQRNSGVF
jgi:hypothetical protein